MGEFLREHQTIAAPIIEWGGLFLLLLIILSPLLVIRHPYFRPTRWWHVIGAYLGSFALLFLLEFSPLISRPLIIATLFNSVELAQAYDNATFMTLQWLLFLYPLSIFYCTYLLYEKLDLKKIFASLLLSTIIFCALIAGGFYLIAYGLGQASMNF